MQIWARLWGWVDIKGKNLMTLGAMWTPFGTVRCIMIHFFKPDYIAQAVCWQLRFCIRKTTIWCALSDSSQFWQLLLDCIKGNICHWWTNIEQKLIKLRSITRKKNKNIFAMQVWNTRPGGALIFAPPCSSWVFLSRSVTKRSWSNPGGDESNRKVWLTNIFIRRMLYVLRGSILIYIRMMMIHIICWTSLAWTKFVLRGQTWNIHCGGTTSIICT